ncbi:MAG: sigma-70 family RNA polymerase sigma factor [Lentisphaeraceae bacterium]|nr:sigma-70 family RNA polymerase sigma factor [Lentisphaeraceae bacterium]
MKLSDEDILAVLMKARERISASVWLIIKDTQISEDIFQNVTLKALTKGATFDSEGHLLSWSFISAKREAIDWIRKHKRENTGLDEDVLNILENDWLTRSQSKNNQHIEALRDCIESVPENSRQLLKLRYFDGHNCNEVGKLIGLGLDAVYKRLSRLHKNIKKCMECKLEKNSGAS